jgi:hypothetical protein
MARVESMSGIDSADSSTTRSLRASVVLVLALVLGAVAGVIAFRVLRPSPEFELVSVTATNVDDWVSPGGRGVPKGKTVGEFHSTDGRYLTTSTEHLGTAYRLRFRLPNHPVAVECYEASRLDGLDRGRAIEVFVDSATAIVDRIACIYGQ